MLRNPLHNRLHAWIGVSALSVGFLAGLPAGFPTAILITVYWSHDHAAARTEPGFFRSH